jgi:hypothetical protein
MKNLHNWNFFAQKTKKIRGDIAGGPFRSLFLWDVKPHPIPEDFDCTAERPKVPHDGPFIISRQNVFTRRNLLSIFSVW